MDLHLPPEIENSLRQHAALAGMDVEQFAIQLLQRRVSHDERAEGPMLPRDDWKARFDTLIASFPSRTGMTRVDCSRESIYGDRGR